MKKILLFKSFFVFLIWFSFTTLSAQVVADFEGVTKGAYATGSVTMNGYNWELTEVVISSPSSASDWKIGERSARLRGYQNSEIVLLTEKSGGIGNIFFQYRRYGTDPQVDWKVEYTLDDGSTWTQAGDAFTAPATDEVQTFLANVNLEGDVRVRIARATDDGNITKDRRLNIDNITISNCTPSLSNFSVAGGPIFYPNDELNFTWTAVCVSEIRFEMRPDGETGWESAEGLDVVDATTGSFNFTLPLNVESETINLRIVDNSNSSVISNIISIELVDNFFAGPYLESDLYPKDNATDVPIDLYNFMSGVDNDENPWAWSSRHEIMIEFHEEFELNTGNITISKQGEMPPVYIFDVATASNIEVYWEALRITLPENLKSNTTYNVVVDAEAFADKAATPNLSDEITWSFTTGTRVGSNVFTGLNPRDGLYPADNAEEVFTDLYFYRSGLDQDHVPWIWEEVRTIMVEFIDDVERNSGYISIFKGEESTPVFSFDVSSAPEVWIGGRSLRITLPQNLLPNTIYKIVADAGVVVDQSIPSNEWEGVTWSFTTAQTRGGEFSPQFNPGFGLYPSNGAEDIPTDLFLYHEDWDDHFFNTIILNLDENITKGTGNITVTNLAESEPLYTFDVATAENIHVDGYTVEINLPENLLPNTTYQVVIPQGAIVDRSPTTNEWEGKTWIFTTGGSDSFKSIYEIRDQKNEPTFVGEYVRTSGVVTKKLPSGTLFLQDDDSRGWSGIFVNDTDFGSIANEGDEFTLVGKVGFTDGMAQLSDIVHPNRKTTNQSFTPKLITLPFTEEYESMLVKIENVSVEGNPVLNQEFWVSDGEKTALISKLWYIHPAAKDQEFTSITGVLHREVGQNKLAPRNAADVVTVVVSSNDLKSPKPAVSINSATNTLDISAPSEIEFVEMVSIVGERVVKESGSNRSSIYISTAGLYQGVYVMKIVLENGETLVMKIFKK